MTEPKNAADLHLEIGRLRALVRALATASRHGAVALDEAAEMLQRREVYPGVASLVTTHAATLRGAIKIAEEGIGR